MSPVREKPICSECGSDDVLCDAYASWNTEQQEWVLSSEFPNYVCEGDCGGGQCSIEWVPLEDTPEIDTHLIETFDNMDELQPLVTSIQRSNAS